MTFFHTEFLLKNVPYERKEGPYWQEKRSLYILFFIPKGLWGLGPLYVAETFSLLFTFFLYLPVITLLMWI